MSKTQAWQLSYYVKDKGPVVSSTEYSVPALLVVSLRMLQCMGSAPVRLRWSRGNRLIEVSPDLVVFQRLVMILGSVTAFIGLGYDFISNNHVRVGTAIFTGALWITEICLVVSICLIRSISAPATMDRLITLLKQMNKINNGLNHGASAVKCSKFRKLVLFAYIIWVVLIHITDYFILQFSSGNHLVMTLYTGFYYQTLAAKIIQLQIAVFIAEMASLFSAINDHLERLLQSVSQNCDDAVNPKYGYLTIRQLAQYHEQICDMVKDVDEDSGPILLVSFMLVFLELLITPYNLISSIVLQRTMDLIIQQTCWSIYHFASLLVIVEPCHWIQDQMDRTRYVLSRLARRSADSGERFFKELDLFILQVQLKGVAISPMGVFTVSRPLVASIIGGVTTYLAIIIQMRKVSELL